MSLYSHVFWLLQTLSRKIQIWVTNNSDNRWISLRRVFRRLIDISHHILTFYRPDNRLTHWEESLWLKWTENNRQLLMCLIFCILWNFWEFEMAPCVSSLIVPKSFSRNQKTSIVEPSRILRERDVFKSLVLSNRWSKIPNYESVTWENDKRPNWVHTVHPSGRVHFQLSVQFASERADRFPSGGCF